MVQDLKEQDVSLRTSIVDEEIQSGLRFQEGFTEAADRLQTGKV